MILFNISNHHSSSRKINLLSKEFNKINRKIISAVIVELTLFPFIWSLSWPTEWKVVLLVSIWLYLADKIEAKIKKIEYNLKLNIAISVLF